MVGFSSEQTPLVSSEDFYSLNPQFASPVSGEDFFVDQLLNFNNEEVSEEVKDNNGDGEIVFSLKEETMEEKEAQKDNKVFSSVFPSAIETELNIDDFGSQLSAPDEEADLEWLSHFVEESFSQFSNPYPPVLRTGPFSEKHKSEPPLKGLSKARRSKRSRSGGRVWSVALTEPSSSESSHSHPTPCLTKKRVRGSELGSVQPRRCSHCGVHKTPQWRAGPLGTKTLCNACGVRFKSGRLLPEYRPACSPSFSSELHSNNHRKVLEMRRKKEVLEIGSSSSESSLVCPVPSFG